MSLPAIICLKSVYINKFLRYRTESLQSHGLLQFSGDKVTDSLAQFDVIPSVAGCGLVHFKSRYTNKFLVRWSPTENFISASADKLNEDQTNWACTLFKPSFVDGDTAKIRLLHVQLGLYTQLLTIPTPFDSCLIARSQQIDPNLTDVFIVIDWASVLKLPKNVAFKGENGKYLGPFISNGIPYLQFSYDSSSDPKVAHEVFSSNDGTVTIKSKHYGKFWRLGSNDWIVADVVEPAIGDANSMFRVNAMDVNIVTLLNMKKTWYCKRYTESSALESLMKSAIRNADDWSVLEVKDLGP